jgi:hypothetical protein
VLFWVVLAAITFGIIVIGYGIELPVVGHVFALPTPLPSPAG